MNSPLASCWLTASEIAARCLPGLPADKRAVNALAAAQCWTDSVAEDGSPLARRRAARGGGTEYHASLLPEAAQEVLSRIAQAAPIAANDTGNAEAEAWAWYAELPAPIKTKAIHRLTIIGEVEARMDGGATKTAASQAVARAHGVSPRVVADWFALVADVARSDWLPRLAPQYKGGGKKVDVDAEVWRLLKTDYLRPEQPSFAACYNRVHENYAKPRGITLPNMKTLRRHMDDEISKSLQKAEREGREALRRTVPPQRRTVAGMNAMDAVNIDGHTFDVFVQWEDGKIGRPVMVGIQDIYSRKLLAHSIDKSESTLLTRIAFANLFRDWGIPHIALMDNGRAFASKALTGGAKTRYRFKIKDTDPTGVLTALNIKVKWALPYRGSSKPVERTWRDLCEYIAKHPAISGAYTGNKPDAKPENYRSRAIPIAEFEAFVSREIAAHNARTGRDTETAEGGSFDAAFSKSYAATQIGKASPAQLRLALLVAEDRRCHHENGSVTLAGNRYWMPDMVELAGEKVVVRCDPDNLHGELHIYRVSGEYFGAAPVIEKTGFFDKAGAERRAKLEKDVRRKVALAREAADLLTREQLAEIYSTPLDPAPKPVANVVRAVRHRGHTAAAIKPIQQADQVSAEPAFIDAFAAAASRLRSVE